MKQRLLWFIILCVAVLTTAVLVRKKTPDETAASATEANATAQSQKRAGHSSPSARTSGDPQPWRLPFKPHARLDNAQRIAIAGNPEAALNRAIANRSTPLHLIVAWAGKDPDAAQRWVNANADATNHSMADLLGALAAGALIHGGHEAMAQWIEKFNEDPRLSPKHQGTLEAYAFRMLARADTLEQALMMIKESKNTELAGALVEGMSGSNRKMAAIDYLRTKGLTPTLNYWSIQHAAGKEPKAWVDWAFRRNSDMLPELIQSWARKDSKAAKAWVQSDMLESDPRRADILSLIE